MSCTERTQVLGQFPKVQDGKQIVILKGTSRTFVKILFISKSHNPIGGVERWLTDLAVGLATRDHECMVGLAHGRQFHDADAYRAVQQELEILQIFKIECVTGSAIERRNSLIGLIRKTRPDIVIPVMLHETLGAVSACRARGQALKLVYPVHETEVWAYRAIAEYADSIDAVVSVNKLMQEALSKYLRWPEERNFHVRCGVGPPRNTECARFSSEVLEIGFCGRLSEGPKRPSDLIKFCRAMDQYDQRYRLSIAGSGSSEELLRRHLREHIGNGQVRVLGWLSEEELYRSFYPNLDVLLITSEWETGPLVAWEAMMHDVLIVTSQYRGLRREGVLRDAETALVFPVGEMNEAVRKLCEVSADPVSFRRIAKKGRDFAQQYLGVERMVTEWAAGLETILNLPDKPPRQRMHYDPPAGLMEWIEHYARTVMNRPIRHSNAHAEWPRYKPGHVTEKERTRFVEELDKLEAALVKDEEERQMAQAERCEHGI